MTSRLPWRPFGWLVASAAGIALAGIVVRIAPTPKPVVPRPQDYSHFASLSDDQKATTVMVLWEPQFVGPECKPICRDVLATHCRYCGSNEIGLTGSALIQVAKRHWQDCAPLVSAIYRAPANMYDYQAAHECLRSLAGRPVPPDLAAAVETLRLSGYTGSGISAPQWTAAKQRLLREPDKEMVLVYAICLGGGHYVELTANPPPERDRLARRAAWQVLGTLDQKQVRHTLKLLWHSFGDHKFGAGYSDYSQSDLQWLMEDMHLLRVGNGAAT